MTIGDASGIPWDSRRGAVIVCDMWDLRGLGHCVSATARIVELAPAIDHVVSGLREQGALIIHAPSECMDFYRDTPARLRALAAAHADAPVPFGWNWPDATREPLVPGLVWSWSDPGLSCSCDSPRPCVDDPAPPWTRQIDSIEVKAEDAVTDDGQELFNLLEERGIEHVLLTGVHTNVCVLSREFGIRQLAYLGKMPILCRDLTDSFHRLPIGHFAGNRQIVEHIERHWCPTVTSDQLVGGEPFRFAADR
jgi:nicotinamidase-related amidase